MIYSAERRFRYDPKTREFQERVGGKYESLPPVPRGWNPPAPKKRGRPPKTWHEDLGYGVLDA